MAILTLVIASMPLWLSLPAPSQALQIDHARFTGLNKTPETVSLPHIQGRHRAVGHYQISFELSTPSTEHRYLFIPVLSYRAIIAIDGDVVSDTGTNALIPGITLGVSALVPLSGRHLAAGRHVVDILLEAPGIARGYLSPVYVGTAPQIVPYHRLRVFVLEHTRTMVLACQLLLAIATLMAWCYRPQESLYGWLFLLHGVSLASYAGLLADLVPDMFVWIPYMLTINMASVFILHIIALKIGDMPTPRGMRVCVVLVPAVFIVAMAWNIAPASALVSGVITIMVLSPLITVAISAWAALVKKVSEAWLLLVPLCIFSITALYDGALVIGLLDGPVFLSLYYRQLLIVAIVIILMRRLGLSLMRLDSANAHLTQRLAEREAELRRLHDEERIEATGRVRSEERQRLTEDLHDGLSGHLSSIIAQAEREHTPGIERTARDALDDLRLVIHSLDIGDRELTVALSCLRERLESQLRRLGVTLEWTMIRLPEISGVTPAHALSVLRIVQEAITNAIRHGPASHIAVRGSAGPQGEAIIVIENDGTQYADKGSHSDTGRPRTGGSGTGIRNMNRRAAAVGGTVCVEAVPHGTRVTLSLPRHLSRAPAPANT